MDWRVPHSFGSAVSLAGAFAIGWALHVSLVTGEAALLDPAPVLATLLGLGLVATGRAMERRFDPSTLVPDSEGAEEEDEEAFDGELSPVDEEMLAGRERDESVDLRREGSAERGREDSPDP